MVQLLKDIAITIAFFLIVSLLIWEVQAAPPPTVVAVIDTGLDLKDERFTKHLCPTGHKDFTGYGMTDHTGHGTHVAGLIQEYAKDSNYCLVIIKYYDTSRETGKANEYHMVNALVYALSLHPAIVNISSAGTDYNEFEMALLAAHPRTTLYGAAGNDGLDQVNYPCGYGLPNTVCVGGVDKNGLPMPFSNRGAWVGAWEAGTPVLSTLPDHTWGYMAGTSMATAIHTGKAILELNSKH